MRKKTVKLQFAIVLTLSILSMIPGVVFAESYIFWSDLTDGVIKRSNVDGSNEVTIVSGVESSLGMSIDQSNKKIYWSDTGDATAGDETIRRANFDGTGIETILTAIDGIRHPVDIEVDTLRGKIYWTDAIQVAIYRANLDGSLVEKLVDIRLNRNNYGVGPGLNLEFAQVWGLALDTQDMKMYWTDYFGADIHVADFNGLNIKQVVPGLSGTPRGIELDDVGGKIMWVTGNFGHEVMRANKDGSLVETIVSGNLGTDLKYPYEIAIDTNSRFIYWTDMDTGLIQRSNLDGTNVVTVLTLEYEKKPGEFKSLDPAALALFIDPLAPAPEPTPDPEPTPGTLSVPETPSVEYRADKGKWSVSVSASTTGLPTTYSVIVFDEGSGSTLTLFMNLSTDSLVDERIKGMTLESQGLPEDGFYMAYTITAAGVKTTPFAITMR